MRIVIIGNGVAGIEAALTVRNREPDWDISIISEESDHFFSRTALMWVFCGQMRHKDIEPYERDLYERCRFKRIRARALGIDVDNKQVKIAGGIEPIPYDRLLIACGSRPRPGPWPNSDLRGIGNFVTMQNLEWFENEVHGGPATERAPRADAHFNTSTEDSPYQRAESAASNKGGQLSKNPTVIGGGLIGIEAVEVLLTAKRKPKFLIREEWFWPIAVEPKESAWITRRMREHGVDVLLEHNIDQFVADENGNVKSVKTDKGDFDTDLVVICIGVLPNTDWLKESKIDLHERGGIPVDGGLKTSTDDIWAAGDCALVKWFDGSQRPEQLWYTSRAQGRLVGRALCGDPVEYDRGLWFNSAKLMDIEYTTAGLVNFRVENEQNWYYEETGKVRSTTRITLVDKRVIGFNLLGRRWDHTVLLDWIRQRRSLEFVLDNIQKASFDTEFVPPLKIPSSARTQKLDGPAQNPFVRQETKLPF
jgi:NADPH-dependent 2,4-dienoyl-CoA reductase/sulfur reductase-like enzyme